MIHRATRGVLPNMSTLSSVNPGIPLAARPSTSRASRAARGNASADWKNPLMADVGREELAQALVEIGARKDEQSFCVIYNHFAGRVKSFLIGKGMDDETAEELMQEIMITVWRKSHTYDPAKAAASTWIFTIARNRRIDFLRGNYRVEVELDDALLEHESDNEEAARPLDEELNLLQNSNRLHEALEELPKEQKQVMHLSYFRGQSHGDIASWLGLPVGTVKSRIRLALQSVRNNLKEEGIDAPTRNGNNQ